jgi:hypothetical protein
VFPVRSRDICVVETNNSPELSMSEGDGNSGWDFLTVVTWWNLYALPVLLLAASAFIAVRNRVVGRHESVEAVRDGRRLVAMVALIHLAVGGHAVLRLVQELLTMREMGISESFVNLIEESISTVENFLLALGLGFARPVARWWAIPWYLLLSVIGAIVAHWLWRYSVPFDPATWPAQVASKLMPPFLLVVMFLPRVKAVFKHRKTQVQPKIEAAPSRRWSITSLFALLFFIVVVSNFTVDVADWIDRSLSAPDFPP